MESPTSKAAAVAQMKSNLFTATMAFVRLWLVMLFSYFAARWIFDFAVQGIVADMRPVAVLDLLLIPFGQAVVVWIVTRRNRRRRVTTTAPHLP